MSLGEQEMEPHVIEHPPPMWRVGRSDDPLRFSAITAADGALPEGGNRFDVPGGAVLYCATALRGCYAETLARFRPSATIRQVVADEDPSFMVCGGVPADWRHRRLKVRCRLEDSLAFLDVEHVQTHEYLTTAMAGELGALGVDILDVGLVRGRNRLITRTISAWAYSVQDDHGEPVYAGLRYVSRLGEYERWAVFEGAPLIEDTRDTIALSDPDLLAVANDFHLRLY